MTQVVKVVQQPTRVVSIPRAVGAPGAPGEPGTDGLPGSPGADGAPGASAYDTWLAEGHEGSEADFLASLVGPRGEPGADGTPGQDGAPGADGEDGPAGSDGREIALRTATGFVQWQYDGDPGWTNLIALADLTGPRGDDGTDGTDGADGKSVELRVSGGYIQWRQTDGAWGNLIALTAITGPPGEDGAPGAPGTDGTDGAPGADGVSPDLSIGTVTTGAPGSDASAAISGTFPDLHLDLTIPRGADGSSGGGSTNLADLFKGEWSPTSTYARGDLFSYRGVVYLATAASPTPITDTFAGSSLDPAWTVRAGSVTVASGVCTAGVDSTLITRTLSSPDVTVSIKVLGTQRSGIALRAVSAATFLTVRRDGTIYQYTSGSPVSLGSFTAAAAGDTLTAVLSGSTLSVYVNSVLRTTVTGVTGTSTDHGIEFRDSGGSADDFYGLASDGANPTVTSRYQEFGTKSVCRTVDGTAAPTTGTWNRGDQIRNTAPSPGGFIGWVCTTAGTPGTWKTFGAISA